MSLALSVATAFDLGGRVLEVRPYGNGLINDTYLVTLAAGASRHAILQRLNRRVFPEPTLIMQNLRTLSAHVERRAAQAGGGRALELPAIYTARDGRDFFIDEEGGFWRALSFIENARNVERLSDLGQAGEVGFALGRFHALTHDLDPARLHITRPGFHDTPRYLARCMEVAARARPAGAELEYCLAFIEARRGGAGVLEEAKRAGALALRVVHGDPKLDNVLFDATTGRAVSLVDLDTVQPGLLHYDLGDCLRSCCNPAGESPADLAAVRFDLDICRALLDGYFAETRGLLAEADYRYLFEAIRLIPFELGLRFLTDSLEGNHYFKTDWPGQNLHRAMTQFRLAAEIEQQEPHLRALIEAAAKA